MKSKCPSWRGKATVRPRRQGRPVVAFTEAKRKPLTEGADGSGAEFGQEGMMTRTLYLEQLGESEGMPTYQRLRELLPHDQKTRSRILAESESFTRLCVGSVETQSQHIRPTWNRIV